MKNMFFILGVFLAGFLLLSSFSLRENPQDQPHGEKQQKRHLKLVTIEDGKKTELDTIIKGDNIFVWNGDTLAAGEDFQFEIPELPDLDSLTEELNSLTEKITMQFKNKDFDFEAPFVMPPNAMHPPHPPRVFHFRNSRSENIIDLSDPGIISYKKKSIRNGREKIVIIREEKEENENDEKEIEIEVQEKDAENSQENN